MSNGRVDPGREPSSGPFGTAPAATAEAVVRLNATRAQLERALLPAPPADGDPHGAGRTHGPHRDGPRAAANRPLSERFLSRYPLLEIGWPFVRAWWERRPLHHSLQSASVEARRLTVPAIRRHPAVSMLLAALAGAGLAAVGPWRWALLSGRARPLGRRVGRLLAGQATRLATQTAMTGLMMLLAGKAAAEKQREADTAAPDPGEETGASPAWSSTAARYPWPTGH